MWVLGLLCLAPLAVIWLEFRYIRGFAEHYESPLEKR